MADDSVEQPRKFANRAKVADGSAPLGTGFGYLGRDLARIMSMAKKVTVHGASGVPYTFAVTDCPPALRPMPAVYMFACRAVGGWKVLYVGECADLKTCFSNNELWNEAVQWFGATHVLTYFASRNDAARKRIERDLILASEPVMNVSGRTSSSYAK